MSQPYPDSGYPFQNRLSRNNPMPSLADKLAEFRSELVDLAYALEREGRQDAADVALSASARIGELCSEALTAEVASRTADV